MGRKEIVPWDKVGKESTVATSRDKSLTIQHFKNPSTGKVQAFHGYAQPDWSIILPVTADGKIVTCYQYYQGVELILQHLPGGNADFSNEKPSDVAKRELLEETGYVAREMIFLGAIPLSARNSPTITSLFLALGCEKVKNALLDENEIIEVVLEKVEDWIWKTLTEIRETPSIIATHFALPWLRKELAVDINKIVDLSLGRRIRERISTISHS